MPEIKGYKLFVNLGASQTRRRLKGFGHGVRKVQACGKNQAAIIHTATGRNLSELQARFADVGWSLIESELGKSPSPASRPPAQIDRPAAEFWDDNAGG